MKYKYIKIFATALLVGMIGTPVSAAGLETSIPQKVSIVEEEGLASVSDTSYSLTRSNYLNFGHVSLTALDADKVNVYGMSQCHQVVDKVQLNLYLQRKKDDSYYTYKYWKFTKNDAHNLSKEIEVLVPPGSYYKLSGSHAAQHGDTLETTSTETEGLYIGF